MFILWKITKAGLSNHTYSSISFYTPSSPQKHTHVHTKRMHQIVGLLSLQANGWVLLRLIIYLYYFLNRRDQQLLYFLSPPCCGNNRALPLLIPFPLLYCYSFYTGFYLEERKMITFLSDSFLKPFLKLSFIIQALTHL